VSDRLADLVLSFVEEELVIDRANVSGEARSNTMGFGGFNPAVFDPKPVERALLAVGEHLRTRFTDISGPVSFYAWYDEQAGQLRCSVASVASDGLPFGGRYFTVDSPRPVLELMAADVQPGQIDWEELTDLPEEGGGPGEQIDDSFPVFVMRVTG
jgi:hypothetical protein